MLLDLHKGEYLRIGIRGSRKYLDSILQYLSKKSFTIVETSINKLGNSFPIPKDIVLSG